MARYSADQPPYQQSRAALRQIYGTRAINAKAPNVSPGVATPGSNAKGGLSPEGDWRAFFGPKPTPAMAASPTFENIRNQAIRNQVTQKPINDELWNKVQTDTNPWKSYQSSPQPQMVSPLAPQDTSDVQSMASLYQPPPQLGGAPNLLTDPMGFGSLDRQPSSPIQGASTFFQKYGKLRDLSGLGQDSWTL